MSPPSVKIQLMKKLKPKLDWRTIGDVSLYPITIIAILVSGVRDGGVVLMPSVAEFLFASVLSILLVMLAERIDDRLTDDDKEKAKTGKHRAWKRRAGYAVGLGLFWRMVAGLLIPKLIEWLT